MISIIVPIYNAKSHLNQLINCIKKQTFHDYEAILVDNNSSDGSYEYLEKIVQENNLFKLLRETQQGPNYARLKGFLEANGEYVYFCDADDLMEPNALSILHQYATENDSDIVIGDYCEINDKKEITKHCKGINYEVDNKSNILNYEKTLFIKMPLWNKLFKREIIKKDFFVFTKIGEDMLISLSATANSKKISYVDKEVYQYLVSETGLSYNVTLGNVVGIVDTCKGMNKIFIKFFDNEFKEQIEFIQIQHLLYRLLRSTLLKKEEQAEARKIMIPYILSLNIKDNKFFNKSIPYKMAYSLLVNKTFYAINRNVLKFIFTNKTLNKLFKILDK